MFLGIIPARGGSRGIPGKNLLSLGGKPLLAWTAESARASSRLGRTVLSTDDPKIAEAGKGLGLEVPFLRPAEFADDQAPMIGVLAHVLDWWAGTEGTPLRGLVLLQPTSPLRRGADIDGAIDAFVRHSADSVVSVVRVPHAFTPASVMTRDSDGRLHACQSGSPVLRRQDKPEVFARNGPAVLVLKPELIRSGRLYSENTFGYEMSLNRSWDLDNPEDVPLLETLLAHDAPPTFPPRLNPHGR